MLSAAPVAQNETRVFQVPQIGWEAPSTWRATQNESTCHAKAAGPECNGRRITKWDWCSKCCTCQAKWDWGAPSATPATQKQQAPIALNARRTSADISGVLHLPRNMRLRCPKCCTCHAKAARAYCTQSSPDFRWPLWRCSECCTCHATWDWCCVDGVVLMVLCWWWSWWSWWWWWWW